MIMGHCYAMDNNNKNNKLSFLIILPYDMKNAKKNIKVGFWKGLKLLKKIVAVQFN